MGKRIELIMVVIMLICSTAIAEIDDIGETAFKHYRGVWVSDGIAVEIWRESEAIQCRAVVTDGGKESDIWEYHACVYNEAKNTLQCHGVTRTRECFNLLLDMIDELDWSMDDMSISELQLSKDDLLFTDDELDAPVALKRLSVAKEAARNEALAFVGLWNTESSTLRVEDHGVCYQFTVNVSSDDETSCRWSYTCLYDSGIGRIASVSVSLRTVVTRKADGGTTEVEEDFAATKAEFILEDGNQLVWRDTAKGTETAFDWRMD